MVTFATSKKSLTFERGLVSGLDENQSRKVYLKNRFVCGFSLFRFRRFRGFVRWPVFYDIPVTVFVLLWLTVM